MLLFILAYDPLIKFICSRLPVEHSIGFGYCDDLGIASEDIFHDWPIVQKCFHLLSKATLLCLNVDKNQFLFTCHGCFQMMKERLLHDCPDIGPSQIQEFIKYLGIFLGRDTSDMNWEGPLRKFISAIHFIAGLECGFQTSIILYNMLAVSTLTYVGTFAPPTRAVLRTERWGLQKILRGAWNAIPSSALPYLREIGFRVSSRPISVVSSAAMVRAASSSHIFRNEYDRHIALTNGDDVTLHAMNKLHLSPSFFEHWRKICHHYDLLLDSESTHVHPRSPVLFRQWVVHRRLFKKTPGFDFHRFFQRRLGKFFGDEVTSEQVQLIIRFYKELHNDMGPRFIFSHFRTIANHWCSSSRFGFVRQACHFCRMQNDECNDRIPHSLLCPKYLSVFCAVHNLRPMRLDLKMLLTFTYRGEAVSPHVASVILYYVHLCFGLFNQCRHGKRFSERLMTASIKKNAISSPAARRIYIVLRRDGL